MNVREYEEYMKNRPHVVLLGAGASMAAIPNGDKNGKKTSVMVGFIEKLGMGDIFKAVKLQTSSDNLEDIYSELKTRKDCSSVLKELENRIYDYFFDFQIPEVPTVYDYLLLSLTKKDLVATFNWDPLLLQAYKRANRITSNLPQLAFLHGNVYVGICHDHKITGLATESCPKCGNPFKPMKLLYPVKEKNYIKDPYIADSWNFTKQCLKRAYMFTIFGYSAPKTDISAISLLQEAWGLTDERSFEEIEIIDIRDEDGLRDAWDSFIHTHHYSTHTDFVNSSLGIFPRRSCEATFDRLMNCRWLDATRGFRQNMTFGEIEEFLLPLLEDEDSGGKVLKNPYI